MYIWVAIDVDKQLEIQKEIVKNIEEKIGIKQSNASLLPLHISLKISAEVPKHYEAGLRKDITLLFESTNAFVVEVDRIELRNTIVWIKMKESEQLTKLHNELCSLYNDKYGIALHEFDMYFMYHSTLFLDSDESKVQEAFEIVKTIELPTRLTANRFIIGSSPKGKIGTYSVDDIIEHSL